MENFDKNFPDTPTIGPYNNIVDAVPIEEVCQMKVFGQPENRIGPPPNLFENPGALGQQLQKWFLESQADVYCEPCPNTPGEGSCYCWPYFVTIKSKVTTQGTGTVSEGYSTSAAWGPIYGTGTRIVTINESGLLGFNVFVIGQKNPGRFSDGRFDTCEVGTQEYMNSGGSGYSDVEILEVGPITPFSVEDCELYFGYAPSGGGPTATTCPVPPREPPLGNYPNTRPVYMPLPTPAFVFPPPSGCPTEYEPMNFIVNYIESPGAPGAPGEKGPPGPPGDSIMRTPRQKSSRRVLQDVDPGTGAYGIRARLPASIAYVNVTWKSTGLNRSSNGPRILFEAPYGQGDRREILCGNLYLVHEPSNSVVAPYMHSSADSVMVFVPDSHGEEIWSLQVRDTFDVGFTVESLGSFYSTWKFQNPEDIPELRYEDEYPF
jgi:hypothetical protein